MRGKWRAMRCEWWIMRGEWWGCGGVGWWRVKGLYAVGVWDIFYLKNHLFLAKWPKWCPNFDFVFRKNAKFSSKFRFRVSKHEIENSRKLLKITKPKIFAATLGSVCHTKIWWGEGEKNVLIICKSLHTSSWQDPLNVYRSKLNYCTFSVSDEHAPQCFLSVRFSHFFSVKYSLFNMNEAR